MFPAEEGRVRVGVVGGGSGEVRWGGNEVIDRPGLASNTSPRGKHPSLAVIAGFILPIRWAAFSKRLAARANEHRLR